MKLFGFEIKIRHEFLLVALLLGYSIGDSTALVIWCGVLFISVLFHELGHAVVARHFGYRPWIELYGMGGLTHCEVDASAPPRTGWLVDLAISVAGPGAGLLLGGLVYLASRGGTSSEEAKLFVSQMLWVNVGWSLWNLLPVLPMDGGHVFTALVTRFVPRYRFSLPHWVTLAIATLSVVGGLFWRQWWIAYLMALSLARSWRALGELRQGRRVGQAWGFWDTGDLTAAQRELSALTRPVTDQIRYKKSELEILLALRACDADAAKAAFDRYASSRASSTFLLAVVALDRGELDEAERLIGENSSALLERVLVPLVTAWAGATDSSWIARAEVWVRLPMAAEVLQALGAKLFYANHFELSLEVHERLFGLTAAPFAAYNAACCLARASQPDAALIWLERARVAGLGDPEALLGDDDLSSLRARPEFIRIVEAIRAANATSSVA
ncbi:MAG TPA: site-2 protease family protein [Polyangiaceae bacterium]|nr:site-2 protease family protein [Polyangiaceae bacterium]